jgi:SAM-dependent methyltransferase
MNENTVKQSVIDGYGKLAKSANDGVFSKLFACCDPRKNAFKVGEAIGYSEDSLVSVPDHSNLGVGCGNPSALTVINEGDTVVDLGSGAGFDAFVIAPLVEKTGKVIGIDLSEDMLKLARKNAKKGNYEHVEFLKGDIEDLPLPDELADLVISNCVINLSLKKDKVYKEAFRVLKKGGQIAISDIVLERELPDFIKSSIAGHIACVSGAEKVDNYIQYIKDAGFSDIKIVSKADFPLELMLADPQVAKIAGEMNFSLDSEEAKDIASRVTSISITAIKK